MADLVLKPLLLLLVTCKKKIPTPISKYTVNLCTFVLNIVNSDCVLLAIADFLNAAASTLFNFIHYVDLYSF